MFTGIDKALVALILAVLSIVATVWGVDWFDHVTEESISVIIAVLMPLLVWLVPNKREWG
jgi:hypothetical protein